MKANFLATLTVAGLVAAGATAALAAQPPKMKMTTEVPPGIATPDRLETRIGTLELFDGVPTQETAQKVYDNLDLQRGVQAYLDSIQIASMYGMRKGILDFGPANTTALLFETLMDSKALWLTPNTTSIYMASWLELKDEPMVIETPPNVLGIIDDHWFHYVTDFGNAGPDKGKGGKFLILPPGYKGEVPDGYHVARTNTYGNWVIWRGFQQDGDPAPAVATTKKLFRIYPLSQKDNPPKMNFVNVSGKFNNTIHRMDYGIFEEINEVVQAEPSEGQDPEILGLLAQRLQNKEIVAKLFILPDTVTTPVTNLYQKLGVHNRRVARTPPNNTNGQHPPSEPELGPDKDPAQVEIVEYLVVVEIPIQVAIAKQRINLLEAVPHAGKRLPGEI